MINLLTRVQVRSREGRREWGTAREEEPCLPPAASPTASLLLLKSRHTTLALPLLMKREEVVYWRLTGWRNRLYLWRAAVYVVAELDTT